MDSSAPQTLGRALRASRPFPLSAATIDGCLDESNDGFDTIFRRARQVGLARLDQSERSGHLWRVVGEVAEAVAELVLDELGYSVFWQITTPGIRGVDLLFIAPDDAILALEVKGTLRPGAIPGLTPSRLRQMSREWLNQPSNPAMSDWALEADDLYTGVMVVDLATPTFRIALSGDFESYRPVTDREALLSLAWLG